MIMLQILVQKIIIKHKNNWTTAYAHLGKLLVKKGEIVKTGDIIASVGSTGNVDKSQLHFQVRKNSKPLDPMKFLKKPAVFFLLDVSQIIWVGTIQTPSHTELSREL